jgi:hypothetical protein
MCFGVSRRGINQLWLTSYAGCWASSGYSVQGCAQLEQKLRQCMDAPVRLQALTNCFVNLTTLSSAIRTRRKTISITTSPECIRRSSGLTSGTSPTCSYDAFPVFDLYINPSHDLFRSSTCRIEGVVRSHRHRDGVNGGRLALYISNLEELERSPPVHHSYSTHGSTSELCSLSNTSLPNTHAMDTARPCSYKTAYIPSPSQCTLYRESQRSFRMARPM